VSLRPRQQGFTLVELVIVILISSALSIVVMQFITAPIDAYVDQGRRARLVGIAQSATGRIVRDMQQALPNSIRIGCAGACVEFLRVATAGRYRAAPSGDTLSFLPTDADASFDVLGPFDDFAGLATAASATACISGAAACVAIYNTGQAGTDAWNTDHVSGTWRPDNLATLTAVNATSVSFNNANFASGDTAFPAASPGQRFYVVDSPISYLCDTGAGTLRRYEGYGLVHPHTAIDEHAELTTLGNPAEHALVADQIESCTFTYAAGTPSRNGLLTVRIRVAEAGEGVTLLEQVHVPNMP
jgi:MSHA biogenesis protein MshO